MTAIIEPIQTTAGIAYRVTRVFPNWASAQRGKADLDAINPAAFQAYTPGLCAGEPMDAPEGFAAVDPRTGTVTAVIPPGGIAFTVHANDEGFSLTRQPPPCDGLYPDGYGQAAAHAQLEAAVGPVDGCDAISCVLDKGSD